MSKRSYKDIVSDLIAIHEEALEWIQKHFDSKLKYAKGSHEDMKKAHRLTEFIANNICSKSHELSSIQKTYKYHQKIVSELKKELETL